jgi:hypothetical protein
MTERNIVDLRAVLFETIQGIKGGSIDIEKAKAINELSQTIINSAKVEVDHMRIAGSQTASGFIPSLKAEQPTSYRHTLGNNGKIPI